MAAAKQTGNNESQAYLPDFCAAGAILIIVVVATLVAIMLTLAARPLPGTFMSELGQMAMFVVWIALLGTGLLCKARSRLERFGKTQAFIISFLLLVGLCAVLAESTWQLTRKFNEVAIINDSHAGFVLRTITISSIVIALGMRYLYISSEWRRSIVLEAQSRISALQAMIRPHFLFNSLNTIASLARSDPSRAEEAVEDLADLMRANLGTPKNRVTLKEELEVAAIYQRIEKLRLGDRLKVKWNVAELPMRALIPSLTIQPLLENAIYHGIELLPDGGEVVVTGSRIDGDLEIVISNPVASASINRRKDGNQMALSNIRQRFDLAYGNRAAVEVVESKDRYSVRLRFPRDDGAA
ncbi:MAG: histidine kinase [Gammaproteobacteria bacterium]|nr:histidine kinase [Gammaproteobacteria bacterium]MDH4314445.1 histidine kinase [Gammaproteobacteria bacterium]MDH5213294.1 histidine kinase [Gammaproteobacteria bacterium]